jgi:hypothetical protein
LLVNIVFEITRKRSDNFHLLLGQELRKVSLALHKKHRKIASVDDLSIPYSALFHEIFKIRIHFWGPTRNIHRRNLWSPIENIQDLIHGSFCHTFGAVGAGIHMTVVTGLITDFPHIDLKGGNGFGHEWALTIIGQNVLK